MFVTECFQVIVWIQKFKVSPTGATYLHIKTFTLGKTLSSHTRFHLHSTFKLKGILVLQHKAPFTVFQSQVKHPRSHYLTLGSVGQRTCFQKSDFIPTTLPPPPFGLSYFLSPEPDPLSVPTSCSHIPPR